MKKLIIITLSIVVACIIINITVLTARSADEPLNANRIYIVKDYEGKVCCFEKSSNSPFIVTETKVIELPPKDRKMLENGIEVSGARKLSRVLEDYRT